MEGEATGLVRLEDQWRGVAEVRPEIVDRLVDYCNERVHRAALEAWVDVAQHVVDELWDGDAEAAASDEAADHATWRALLAREDLALDRSKLSRARGLLRLRAQLPDPVFAGLRISRLFVLIPLKDVEVRRELAVRAYGEGWPVTRLRAEVGRLLGKAPTPPELAPAHRALTALERVDVDALSTLPERQARFELEALDQALREKRAEVLVALAALRKGR